MVETTRTGETGGIGNKHRIVHLIKHCGYGNGSVHVAVDLACLQARAGYAVVVASGGGTFVEMLRQHGVSHVKLTQDMRKPFSSVLSVFRLIRLCRSVRPSILHAHMMGSAVIGYVASLATGIRLVATVHNSFDKHATMMRLAHLAVAVSHSEKDHLIARGFKPHRVFTVVNAPVGSPRETFMKNGRKIDLVSPCITAICGLHRRKGVFDIIKAFSKLTGEFPEWRLYVAGEGPDKLELEALTETAGVADRVTFLGFVAAPKALFQQTDIFVLASYADPGSLSIGEARAAGCAIVATAVGGTPEMLDNGKAGLLIAPGAPEQMSNELRKLMRCPASRSALRRAALDGVERFDVSCLVRRYEEAYASALRA